MNPYDPYKQKPSVFSVVVILIVILMLAVTVILFTIKTLSNNTQAANQPPPAEQLSPEEISGRDAERRVDLNGMQAQLDLYYENNNHYPSLAQMNDDDFREKHFYRIDVETFRAPQGSTTKLSEDLESNQYQYYPTPENCDNKNIQCQRYAIRTHLENRKVISVANLR